MPKLRYIVDVTSALLSHLQGGYTKNETHGQPLTAVHVAGDDLLCEKYKANLEHLIMSFQQAAMNAIVQYYVELIEDSLLRWYQFWLHKKGAIDNWFAEWPNGQHPLSTTWPWNIKPALLVLWGVCWMFYDNEAPPSRNPANIGGPGYSGQDLWTRQAAAESQPSQQPSE